MAENVPWQVRQTPTGPVPVYILQFDSAGRLTSPRSLDALVHDAADATDVVLVSHGWNNDWAAATSRYDRFFDRLDDVVRSQGPPRDRPYRPVYAGVHWPSTALVMPWERGPDIAGGGDGLAGELAPELAALDDDLGPEQSAELRAVLADPGAGESGCMRAAEILASLPRDGDGDDDAAGGDTATDTDDDNDNDQVPADGAELLALWADARRRLAPAAVKPGGIIDEGAGQVAAGPQAAGLLNPLELLRGGVRLATVRQMKDRAGRVGSAGVADAVRRLSDSSGARLHLVGHSYGCRVMLSAVAHGTAPSRDVDSVLLLQPALSAWAFAPDVGGHPGGYRVALDRVRLPVLSTFSAHDMPLTRVFHLAMRRASDLGEAEIAGRPPSRFAALGGFGPQGLGAEATTLAPMPDVGGRYPFGAGYAGPPHEIVGVDGTWCIPGHGEVESVQTAWALLSQVRAPAGA
ncbi:MULTISPECIES: hypothetical protein [unclassified Isoptericola]|uniref:hypothetical protein n=1 Tax=unclassified Isoptericola TaxID=2623355 RepID=UPI003647D473